MCILRKFLKIPKCSRNHILKLNVVNFAQKNHLECQNQGLKEKAQSIEIHWIVYYLFDKLSCIK